METESIIMYALIGLLIPLTMKLLNRSASKKIGRTNGGAVTLRMNRFYQIGGLLAFGIGAIFTFFILTDETETDPIPILVFIWVFCSLMALPLILWYTNHRVTFDQEQLTSWDWRGRKTSIAWKEISMVKFQAMAGYLILKGNDKTVKVHQHLVGLKCLTDMMEDKTNWKAEELGLPIK
ncbi:MAG: folate/biopterin family MFS transporter [Flavobacteriales bacterium]|nr:folate/biopterin family MFS transporter [Flavobacteriales bacterium]